MLIAAYQVYEVYYCTIITNLVRLGVGMHKISMLIAAYT